MKKLEIPVLAKPSEICYELELIDSTHAFFLWMILFLEFRISWPIMICLLERIFLPKATAWSLLVSYSQMWWLLGMRFVLFKVQPIHLLGEGKLSNTFIFAKLILGDIAGGVNYLPCMHIVLRRIQIPKLHHWVTKF